MIVFKHIKPSRRWGALSVAALAAVASQIGFGEALGKGGTAKPPPPLPPGATCLTNGAAPCVTILPPAGPALLNPASTANGFLVSGHIESLTGPGCPAAAGSTAGGTVTVNGVVVTIPSDTIVQYPANTLTWADAVCGINAVAMDGRGGSALKIYPSVEIRIDGNIIGGAAGGASTHVASIVFISQHSVNTASGYISFIDYTDGSIYVSTKNAAGAASETRLLINDPKGRFGREQSAPDVRFSVDDANPTIKAAASGYPMCIPRATPPVPVGGAALPPYAVRVVPGQPSAIPLDPQCPLANRPISGGTTATCRNFASTGIAFRIAGADLTPSPAGTPCSAFVMKALPAFPGTGVAGFNPLNLAGSVPSMGSVLGLADPDPREQAPFMVGDYITWQGTLVPGGNAVAPKSLRATTTGAAGAGDVVWVHTIDANVGIYTQPSTLPAYIAAGDFGLGVSPQPSTAAALAGVEATPRVTLEANTTDVGSLVDVYLDDKGFSLPAATPTGPLVSTANSEYFRWLTMEAMTGTLATQAAGKLTFLTTAQPFGGGIQTQFVGPQPGRARIRAIKVPSVNGTLGVCPLTGGSQNCAVTQSPTRYVRVVLRSLCAPASSGALDVAGLPVPLTNLDSGAFFGINGARPNLLTAGSGTYTGVANTKSFVGAGDGSCLQSAQYANGLFTGQYMAPTTNFIYPENTLAGAPIIPANFYSMGFLVYGEKGRDGNSTAAQVPLPW